MLDVSKFVAKVPFCALLYLSRLNACCVLQTYSFCGFSTRIANSKRVHHCLLTLSGRVAVCYSYGSSNFISIAS